VCDDDDNGVTMMMMMMMIVMMIVVLQLCFKSFAVDSQICDMDVTV
jgi:hypothetical protein